MKKTLIVVCMALGAISVEAQKKPVAKAKAKSVTSVKKPVSVFANALDSFSYSIGLEGAAYYKSQGAPALNTALVKKAFDDVYKNRKLLLSPEQTNMTIQQQLQSFMANKNKGIKEEGKKFLEENKKRTGVIELPNGLQYEIITKGTGPIPKQTDTVKAHYAGSLINGTEFDNSYKRGQPIEIPVTGVIPGWVQALQMMPVGSKWKLFIPSDLGYGERGAGGSIPGGATLIFTIELLEIVHH